MDCPGFQREELVERYLTGSLNPQERESFEEHYFACDPCFAALQVHRVLQAELSTLVPQIKNLPVSRPARFYWKLALAAAAVLILGVLGIRRESRPNSSPAAPPTQTAKSAPAGPSLSELARFDPPNYSQTVLRGNQDKAMREFSLAMKRYKQNDYADAIVALRAAVKLNPQDPGPLFFLGVSHLLANQTDDGIAVLQQCIALGDTPYLEEAHYYLAKAFIRKGDAVAARRDLEEVVRLKGDHEDEAQRLLQQLATLPKDSR